MGVPTTTYLALMDYLDLVYPNFYFSAFFLYTKPSHPEPNCVASFAKIALNSSNVQKRFQLQQ
jgi:hypothetical protein